MKNKRGDIPVTILVLGVVMICGLALLSFYNANKTTENSFVGIKIMKEINSRVEQTLFNDENPIGIYSEKKITEWVRLRRKEKILFSVEYKFAP